MGKGPKQTFLKKKTKQNKTKKPKKATVGQKHVKRCSALLITREWPVNKSTNKC